MRDLIVQAQELQAFLDGQGWLFCFVGGIAVQKLGEPRLTRDLDLSLLTGFGGEEGFIQALLARYAPRIENAESFAVQNRVLLLKTNQETGIDVALAALPFEERAIERSREREFVPGVKLRICSPEDLIVMKAFADRPIDWIDVRSVIIRQDQLDWHYIFSNLQPLCEVKEEPGILIKLHTIRKELGRLND